MELIQLKVFLAYTSPQSLSLMPGFHKIIYLFAIPTHWRSLKEDQQFKTTVATIFNCQSGTIQDQLESGPLSTPVKHFLNLVINVGGLNLNVGNTVLLAVLWTVRRRGKTRQQAFINPLLSFLDCEYNGFKFLLLELTANSFFLKLLFGEVYYNNRIKLCQSLAM